MSFVKGTPTKTLYVHISPFEEALFMAKNINRDTCRRKEKSKKNVGTNQNKTFISRP